MHAHNPQVWQDAWPGHLLANLHDYAMFAFDPAGILRSWHPGVKAVLGFERDDFVGKSVHIIFTEEDVQVGVPEQEMAAARRQVRTIGERWHLKADGSRFWALGNLTALFDAEDELLGYAKIVRDVTSRKVASEARQAGTLRDHALAEVSRKLITSLDLETTLQRAAELTVPELADWCSIDLLTPQGTIELAALAHADPAKVEWARASRKMNTLDDPRTAEVIRTGQSQFYPEVSMELFEQANPGLTEEEGELLHQVGLRSIITVPLNARGQTFGALSMVWSDTDRHYSEADLTFAEELGRWVAIAVDHALLYREAQEARHALAEANQRLKTLVSERTSAARKLAAQLTRAESRERYRLAQLLHDELQQEIYAAQFMLTDLKYKTASLGEPVVQALDDDFEALFAHFKTTVQAARGLTADLNPPSSETLRETFTWLAAREEEHYGLKVHLELPEELPPPHETLRVLLLAAVRELLFNVVKHADTDTAWVRVQNGESDLAITVEDNGCGFDSSKVVGGTGLGLSGIEERLSPFGGTVNIHSSPDEGTLVTINVPLDSLTMSEG